MTAQRQVGDRAPQAGRRTGLIVLGLALPLCALHALAVHQGPDWTSPLLLGDHLFDLMLALAILLVALALGRVVARPLLDLDQDRLTDTLAATGLGLGTLSLGILCAGFLGLYYAPVLLLGAVVLVVWLRHQLAQCLEEIGRAVAAWIRAGVPTAPTLAQRLLLLMLVLALLPLLLEAMLPVGWGSPVEWDAPAYHLAAPKLYLAAHHLIPLPAIPLANAPSAQEMLYLPGLAAGTDGVGKMLSVLGLVLLGLAVFACGRRHFGSRAGWLSLFLLYTVHWLAIEAPTTLPDFTSFFLLLLAVSDALAWLDAQGSATGRQQSRWSLLVGYCRADRLLVRSGLLLGLAISTKLVNLPGIPALVLAVGLVCLARNGPGLSRRLVTATRAGGMIGLLALLALSPWLLKNIYFFGHPFYQIAVQVSAPAAGSISVTQAAQHTLFGHLQWLLQNMLDIAWHSISPLSVVLPAAPLLLRRRSGQGALAFLFIGCALWLTFVPRFIEPRYYVGLMAVGEVLIAATICDLLDRIQVPISPRIRVLHRVFAPMDHLLEVPLALYLFWQGLLLLGLMITQANTNQAPALAQGSISRSSYLASRVRPYQAEEWINLHTPSNATVAMLGVTRGYYLDRSYLPEWYDQQLAAIEWYPAARKAALAVWCRAGVHYAVLDRGNDLLDDDSAAEIRPLARFSWVHTAGLGVTMLFSARGVDVLRVSPCSALSGG